MATQKLDPSDFVETLLGEFDGSAQAAAQIRRAIIRASPHLPPDHSARSAIDGLHKDLDVARFLDGDVRGIRAVLLENWQAIAAQLRQARH